VKGRKHKSINVICDSLPEVVEGDFKQSSMSPVTVFSKEVGMEGDTKQSISFLNGRRQQSINVTFNCLLEGMEGDTYQSMSPVTAFLGEWKETPINQCHP
jgi:hypothetical protein